MKSIYKKPQLELLTLTREDILSHSENGFPDTDPNDKPGSAIELPKIDL